jgi:RNA polymerase sigma factor (sigma-70 family)
MLEAAESDESLIERYAHGESAAFTTLYRRHEMRVWRYIKRSIEERALADELMQEVWFAVARDASRYRPTARFSTWLFAIARHRVIDTLRVKRRYLSLDAIGPEAEPVLEQLSTEPAANPLAAVVVRDQATALSRALGQLPAEQRDAFLLQAEADLTVEEIAALTGASFETTKSRLRYARTKLRELLSEYA